jgi:hypothetical protein
VKAFGGGGGLPAKGGASAGPVEGAEEIGGKASPVSEAATAPVSPPPAPASETSSLVGLGGVRVCFPSSKPPAWVMGMGRFVAKRAAIKARVTFLCVFFFILTLHQEITKKIFKYRILE